MSNDIESEKDAFNVDGSNQTAGIIDLHNAEIDEGKNGNEIQEENASESYLHEVSNRLVTQVLENLQQDIMNENTLRGESNVSLLESEFDSSKEIDSGLNDVDSQNGESFENLLTGSSAMNTPECAIKTQESTMNTLQSAMNTEESAMNTTESAINTLESSMINSAITAETVSPIDTPEDEHAKGFYEVNPEKQSDNLLDLQTSDIIVSAETVSPVETPEEEHATGFYEVNPEKQPETVETSEHEHVTGFYEVNPVINVPVNDTNDELDKNLVGEKEIESESDKLHAELTGAVLQNIDIGQISSPIASPLQDNIAGKYQINPMIPDITIDEVMFEDSVDKSDVFHAPDVGYGVVKEDKFKEMTSNLVESVINGAIQIVVNMKQSGTSARNQSEILDRSEEKLLCQNDTSVEGNRIESGSEKAKSDFLQESNYMEPANDDILIEANKELYPVDSDSDDSAGSSTTTEGSYRISNSRDTSPLNTPENTLSLEEFISSQRDKSTIGGDLKTSAIVKAKADGESRAFSDTKHEKQERNMSQNKYGNKNTESLEQESSLHDKSMNYDENDKNRNDTESKSKENEYNTMDIGDSVVVSEISSEESDYMKEHKSEYKTRKQIFMTSAGRMSISIDSVMDPPSDPDQPYTVSERDTIHEERDIAQEDSRAEVNHIIARAQSIVGHADETLARLSDATIARLREIAHVALVDDACMEELDVVYDYPCSSLLCEVLLFYLPHHTPA